MNYLNMCKVGQNQKAGKKKNSKVCLTILYLNIIFACICTPVNPPVNKI